MCTILVVDDEPAVRQLLSRFIELDGHAALMADGGKQGLEMVAGHPDLDLIVSDVQMPGMNGLEFADAVLREHPAAKILLISGYSAGAEALGKSGLPLIRKPFSAAQFREQIRRMVT